LHVLNLNDLRIFVQAVDAGGFAAAARRLGCPKSTISKRVAVLEAGLGVQLLHRTSRRFVLTGPGEEFYDHARAAVIEAEAAENAVLRRISEPTGIVRITASVPTTQFRLAIQLPSLARQFPKLEIRLHVTDRFVDLVQEGFDLAVRSHMAPLPDSDLLQRQIRTEPIILVASPDYLARRGKPAQPEAVARHDGLMMSASRADWTLADREGRQVVVKPHVRFFADESMALLRAAEASLGIVALPQAIAAPSVESGALDFVLPGWTAGTVTTTILTPHRRGQLPAVRAVMDFLAREAKA
jgi:DNA-binding transcriptional LysR family regulator